MTLRAARRRAIASARRRLPTVSTQSGCQKCRGYARSDCWSARPPKACCCARGASPNCACRADRRGHDLEARSRPPYQACAGRARGGMMGTACRQRSNVPAGGGGERPHHRRGLLPLCFGWCPGLIDWLIRSQPSTRFSVVTCGRARRHSRRATDCPTTSRPSSISTL